MKTITHFIRCAFAIACVLLSTGALRAEEVAADEAVAAEAGATTAEEEAAASASAPEGEKEDYLRIMPRFYDFSGDQGYLQRYRSLDADNANGLDEALAVLNEFSFTMFGPESGAPRLELLHTNPFILNDQWDVRYRPGTGTRFDLTWDEYQRPLEAFLPDPAEGSVSYAQRYNNDMDPGQELYRKREDLVVTAHFEPFVWSDGLAFVRDAELSYGSSARRGYRQFSWIFGTVEDLVSPAGNNPERWRGRTEEIDQEIDRYALSTTLMLGKGNVTRIRVFGEEFDNGAPTITNADIALISPAINTQPRTINYIAGYSLSGGAVSIEQALTNRLLLVADGLTEELEQDTLAPLESQAVYEAEISFESLGAGLYFDATDELVLEATGRWSKRTNDTPVGTSASEPRPYLIQDRNLSSPFLRELKASTYGGVATFYAKKLTARAGVSHEDAERELIRPVGTNAIPESLAIYDTDSTPTTLWLALSGRPSKTFRWAARYEHRSASDTWTISDPETAQKLRATASLTSASGMMGATASFAWLDQSNDDFVFESDFGAAPQRMDVESMNLAISGYYFLSPKIQFNGGFQQIDRDQEGNLVLTDVRRWRPVVTPRVADDEFGYDSAVQVWNIGATMALSEKLIIVPSFIWTTSEGGIESAVAPVRAFSLIDNDALTFAVTSDYQLSPRSQVNLRYAYNDYDDATPNALSGKLQELSLGMTFKF
ncbi:MAG: porin [Acidobacteria bacterium]|nr:porin [Acidobacteriota bacterium]